MTFLRKHSAKIFFAATCVLLALSLSFSAVSLARYVSHSDIDEGAGAAAIKCGFTVGGELDPFINTPFMSQLSNTEPVRTNEWRESQIEIYNHGEYGMRYGYSLVLYLPKYFAESAMIQVLEQSSAVDPSSVTRARTVVKASGFYALDSATYNSDPNHIYQLEKIDTTADGLKISDDTYKDFTGDKELLLSGSGTYDNGAYSRPATVTRSYIANKQSDKSPSELDEYVTTVTLKNEEQVDYCRIVVNFGKSTGDYVIEEGTDKHKFFTLRLSLRDSVIGKKEGATVLDSFFKNNWDKFVEKYADSTPPAGAVQLPEKMNYKWTTGATGSPLSVFGDSEGEAKAKQVYMYECIGALSPSRMSVVFTQMQ